MKIQWKLLALCVAIPLAVGEIAALLTQNGMTSYESMIKPVLSPPSRLFPVVWTILYTLMGVSSYLVRTSEAETSKIRKALEIYGYQLIVNFLWPTLFFSFQWYPAALLLLLLLAGLVILMIKSFYEISKPAAYLNIPYLLWLFFATYLNFAVWSLNR